MDALAILKEIILPILGVLGGCFACYAAIKSDLAVLKVRVDYIERAAKYAHDLADDAHLRLNKATQNKLFDTR